MRHLFLGRPPAHVSWPDTHTLQSTVTQRHLDGLPARLALHPTVTQRHLDGLTATRVRILLEEARGESVEMSRASETEEVPLSVVHLRSKALVVLALWGRSSPTPNRVSCAGEVWGVMQGRELRGQARVI